MFYKKVSCISSILFQSNTLSFINDGQGNYSFVIDSKKYKQTASLPFNFVNTDHSGLSIRRDSIYFKSSDSTLITYSITKSVLDIRYLYIF